MGRLVSIFMPYLVVSTFNKAGVEGVVSIVVGVQIVALLMLVSFGIETRKQPLETLVPGRAGFTK